MSEYVVEGEFVVRRESVVAVRKSLSLQAITMWVGGSSPVAIELVYPSQTARDAAFAWWVEELTT